MNSRKLANRIADDILSCEGVETLLQKRPYTGVKIAVEWRGTTYYAVGFAKVTWPDKWDEQRGIEMAVLRAARDIARQICEVGELVVEVAG